MRSYIERTEYKSAIDLDFIDADKSNYSLYYDLVFDRVRKGGFIIADNVLWSGRVHGPISLREATIDADKVHFCRLLRRLQYHWRRIAVGQARPHCERASHS